MVVCERAMWIRIRICMNGSQYWKSNSRYTVKIIQGSVQSIPDQLPQESGIMKLYSKSGISIARIDIDTIKLGIPLSHRV